MLLEVQGTSEPRLLADDSGLNTLWFVHLSLSRLDSHKDNDNHLLDLVHLPPHSDCLTHIRWASALGWKNVGHKSKNKTIDSRSRIEYNGAEPALHSEGRLEEGFHGELTRMDTLSQHKAWHDTLHTERLRLQGIKWHACAQLLSWHPYQNMNSSLASVNYDEKVIAVPTS